MQYVNKLLWKSSERFDAYNPLKDAQAEILECCSVVGRASQELEDGLIYGLPDCESALYIKVPRYVSRSLAYECFGDRLAATLPFHYVNIDELISDYLSSLKTNNRLGGSVTYHGPDSCTVELGIRRVELHEEQKIAHGLYLFQFKSPAWACKYTGPDFYPRYVAPHLSSDNDRHPIDWASKRAAIVFGYIAELAGRDHPPLFAEYAYTRMAEIVCNPLPACLLEPRNYKLSREQLTLLHAAEALRGEPLSPELTSFIIENSYFLSVADLNSAYLRRFMQALPRMLENGLVIDRVGEFLRATAELVDKGVALKHCLQVTCDIFDRENKPWWFKEDFSLNKSIAVDRMLVTELIASHAGFAFEYAADLYTKVGPKLAALKGVGQERSIDFVCTVARDYGIGNVERAVKVVEFAIAVIKEKPSVQPEDLLTLLKESTHRHRPRSAIIGVLEGPEVNFHKPGLIGMLSAFLGEEYLKRNKLDNVTIDVKHILEASQRFSSPLLERANITPAFTVTPSIPQLITKSEHITLQLPMSHVIVTSVPSPLLNWLEFDSLLHKECVNDPDKVARLYFTVFSAKMPNPLKPPIGFLRFLEKLQQIPDPGWRFVGLEHPLDRAAVSHENKKRLANRHTLISNLVDLSILGVVSWPELEETFNWLTVELTADEKKAIEVDVTWEKEKELRVRPYYRALGLARKDGEFLEGIRLIESSFYGESRLERIAHLQKRRQNLEWEYDSEVGYNDEEADKLEEAARDERLKMEVKCAIAKREEELRLARLKALGGGFDAFMAFNDLVSAGVLPAHDIARCFRQTLCDLRLGQNLGLENYFAPWDDGRPGSVVLDELRRQGILDLDTIFELARRSDDPFDLYRLAGTLTKLAQAYERMKLCADEVMQEISELSYDSRPLKERLDEAKTKLLFTIKESVPNPLLLAPRSFEELIDQAFWVERYLSASPLVEQLKTRLIDKHTSLSKTADEERLSVDQANRNLGITWCVMQALSHHEEKDPLQHLKSINLLPLKKGVEKVDVAATVSFSLLSAGPQAELDMSTLDREFGELWQAMTNTRRDSFGLLPIGGKIHVIHDIDENRLDYILSHFGYSSTAFQVIHARKSLILPPMPSSQELSALAKFLDRERVIDWDHPELQLAIPGRLPPDGCAYLGATILLGTEEGVLYNRDSFATTHNGETDFRIMVYDAGGPRYKFPFDTSLKGRTDILGRRHLGDAEIYQLVGTVLIHGVSDEGPFSRLAEPYKKRLTTILNDWGLEGVLSASWVNSRDTYPTADAALKHFKHAIEPCTKAWFACREVYKKTGEVSGVVADVRNAVDWLRNEIRMAQAELLRSPAYAREREILLGSPNIKE